MKDIQAATLFHHSKDALIQAQESFDALVAHLREVRPDLIENLKVAHGGDDFLSPGSGGSRQQRAKVVKQVCERNWDSSKSDDENIQTIDAVLHSLSFYAPLSIDTYHPIRRQAIAAGLMAEDPED